MQSAIDSHNKEVELRSSIEKLRDALSEELRKAQVEAVNAEQQVGQMVSFIHLVLLRLLSLLLAFAISMWLKYDPILFVPDKDASGYQ